MNKANKLDPLKPITCYFEQRIYTNSNMASIRELIPRGVGKYPDGYQRFTGIAIVKIVLQSPQGDRIQQKPVEFPIDAITIVGAWGKYPALLAQHMLRENEQLQQHIAHAKQPKLLVPNSAVPPKEVLVQ